MNPIDQGQLRLFGQNIKQAVRDAVELRSRLREIPIRDIRDVENMARLDTDARRKLEVPERIADAFIGEVFVSGGNGSTFESARASLTVQAGQAIDGNYDAFVSMRRSSLASLSTDLPADKPARLPFHWPLEFPEVFLIKREGFDALVGNPPFLGGSKISGAFGGAYREHLVKHISNGLRGNADLAAFFLLRAQSLLGDRSSFGLIAVNTISEGDTRIVGLGQLANAGMNIYSAWPNEKWPGSAMVRTSRIHAINGSWLGEMTISGKISKSISTYLTDEVEWVPKPLLSNANIAFNGTKVDGLGFTVTKEDASLLLERDHRNRAVVMPYLIGEDLNSHPHQSPSRWIINFYDWSEERAKLHAGPFEIVERLVKSERQKNNRKERRERWWQYAEKTPSLFHAIGRGEYFEKHPKEWSCSQKKLDRVLVCSIVSKHLVYAWVDNASVFSHRLAVFATESRGLAGLLCSSINEAWARKNSSTLRVDINYTIGSAFETLPFPEGDINILTSLTENHFKAREAVGRSEGLGLTKILNKLHDLRQNYPKIQALRDSIINLDVGVARAYGWDDLDLDHDFYEVPYLTETDCTRFTISEKARLEVLRRLSELNQRRYQEEVTRGLHGGSATRTSGPISRAGRVTIATPSQLGLDLEAGTTNAASPVNAVLLYLSTNQGWHAKADVLAATGITDSHWGTVITDLIVNGKVERQGERRGARYRIQLGCREDHHEGTP